MIPYRDVSGMSDEEIRNRFAEIRRDLGWSQMTMAKVIGCNQSTVSRVEDGRAEARGPIWEFVKNIVSTDGALAERSFEVSRPAEEGAAA